MSLNIIIVGTGMYVCGRGTDEYGTILPALYEYKRTNGLGEIFICGVSLAGMTILKEKIADLDLSFGYSLNFRFFPKNEDNENAYLDAVKEVGRPTMAIVSVPDNLHFKITKDLIENKIHTLVVKPLAPNLKEVNDLMKLQKENNVYCAVEFHKRFDRSNLKLKDTIQNGLIGDPLYFIVEYSQRKNIPKLHFKAWVETTNIFQYLGIHYVDIIYFATGAKPLRAMATGQKNYLKSEGINTYDCVNASVEWEMPNGKRFVSVFHTSWVDPESTTAMSNQMIKVVGTKGRYEADQKRRGITITSAEKGIEEPNPDFCSMYGSKNGKVSYKGYGIDSICQFLEDVTLIESDKAKCEDFEGIRPTFLDAVVPTLVLEAVNKSLTRDGEWVFLHGKKE